MSRINACVLVVLLYAGVLQAQNIVPFDDLKENERPSAVYEWSGFFLEVPNSLGRNKPGAEAKPEAEPEESQSIKTPDVYCSEYYEVRKQYISAIEQKIKDLPAKFDWDKMSFAAKRNVLGPFQKRVQLAKSERKLRFPMMRFHAVEEIGTVFMPMSIKLDTDPAYTVCTVDNRTIVALVPGGRERVLLKGIPIGPFEKPGTEILLTGTWHRVKDTEIEVKQYSISSKAMLTFEPWPFEQEAAKIWEKYLPEQESKAAKASKAAAKAAKEKKVETFLTPTSRDKKNRFIRLMRAEVARKGTCGCH